MDLVYSRPLIHTHSHTDSKRAATQVSCPSVKRSWHLVSCPTTYCGGGGPWDRLSGRPTRPPNPRFSKAFSEKKKKNWRDGKSGDHQNNLNSSYTFHDSPSFLIFIKELMFSLRSVCGLVCQQDYTKTAEQSSFKLGWRMGLGTE